MASSNVHETVEIGRFSIKKESYIVQVFSGFRYPHFALSIIGAGFFTTFLRIDKTDYWLNNWYWGNPSPLTPNLAQHLNAFLNAKSSQNPSFSNWQYIITTWNRLNPDHKVKVSAKTPDYSKAIYDTKRIERWGAAIKASRSKQEEEYEKTLPKWEYAAFNSRGSGDNMEKDINHFARKGFRFCGAVQGHDCPLAVVIMERPAMELSFQEEPDDENF